MNVHQDKSAAASYRESLPDQARASLGDADLFDRLQKNLRRVIIDEQELYVAEGDTLLDEDQLFVYAGQRAAADKAEQASQAAFAAGLGTTNLMAGLIDADGLMRGLLGMVQDGKIVRWRPGTILSYCVLRKTFPKKSQYDLVVKNMELATAAWEATCGVKFQHLQALDGSDSVRPAGVLFPVRHLDAGGAFIAAAFFPNDPINRRRIVIDPSYFTTTFDKVGVLRHELGHVLGFRHEHIRSGAPPVCPDEDPTGVFDLTQYDPQSVMHYFCGGLGASTLSITALDRTGSQRVYGPPLSAFTFVSPSPNEDLAFADANGDTASLASASGVDFAYLTDRALGMAGYDESYFDQPATDEQWAAALTEAGAADSASQPHHHEEEN